MEGGGGGGVASEEKMKNEGVGEKNKMGKEEGETTSKTGNAKKNASFGL